LVDATTKLRDTYTSILDNLDDPVDGELRVKLARAELILNKISKLMQENINS
jgi:hypothetical protein